MWLALQICTIIFHHVTMCLQAELSKKESQTADLQENLKSQRAETSMAKEELTSALSAMEKLKEGFNKEQTDWLTEKAALTQRSEKAEAALKPVVDELTSVKRQVHAMTAAVFGKYPCSLISADLFMYVSVY